MDCVPDTAARLPVPNAHRLVIRGTQDPWILLQTHAGSSHTHTTDCGTCTIIICVCHLSEHLSVSGADILGMLVGSSDFF